MASSMMRCHPERSGGMGSDCEKSSPAAQPRDLTFSDCETKDVRDPSATRWCHRSPGHILRRRFGQDDAPQADRKFGKPLSRSPVRFNLGYYWLTWVEQAPFLPYRIGSR